MKTSTHSAQKFTTQKREEVKDVLTYETPLQILVNDKPFSVTMQTPGNEADLVRGILHSENVFTQKNEILKTQTTGIDTVGNISAINAIIPENMLDFGYSSNRSLTSVSSCGICGKEDLSGIELCGNPITDQTTFTLKEINAMFDEMAAIQETFIASGGCHASAAFGADKKMLACMEDIGRHNAVDKVIGHLLNNKKMEQAKIILVSGRVSYEIVSKAYYAGIPMLAAISAPSGLAVEMAEKYGITLLGFCRTDKLTAYSWAERVRL
ncbi:MAG: formate dehydrogenase accessory sulfurtransferase FdhD [Flavobacteriales bacterium]|nr:formate dehydrogenase accessory sulfurtransferase FdhD [Flavobacteriales bacterium]